MIYAGDQMFNLRQTFIIIGIILLLQLSGAEAATCPACRIDGITSLAMVCPECGADMHERTGSSNEQERASFRIRLLYTGDRPERLPPYAKLYINGRYCGNIELAERQTSSELQQKWANGLGESFSAIYEKLIRDISPGTVKIEIEMKFDRLFGFGRSLKRVVFPYVSFRAGERTTLDHYFRAASSFHQYNPAKPQPLPVISAAKVQGASGTVALNIGLFD